MRIRPTPFRIQKFLGGLRYPARKHQVLERARSRGNRPREHRRPRN